MLCADWQSCQHWAVGDVVGTNGLEGKKKLGIGGQCVMDLKRLIFPGERRTRGEGLRDGADRINGKDVYSLRSVAYWS